MARYENLKIKGTGEVLYPNITGDNIPSLSIDTSKIVTGAVTTTKIGSLAVTSDKIASQSITTDKIELGAVGTSEIADSAITTAKINNLSITTPKIATKAVTGQKLNISIVNLVDYLNISSTDTVSTMIQAIEEFIEYIKGGYFFLLDMFIEDTDQFMPAKIYYDKSGSGEAYIFQLADDGLTQYAINSNVSASTAWGYLENIKIVVLE